MKTTFNRIVAQKKPQKTVDKLIKMGFMHTSTTFKGGRSIDVIRFSKDQDHHLCLIDNDPSWHEDNNWNPKPIVDFEIVHSNISEFSKHVALVDFVHNCKNNHPMVIHSECNFVKKDGDGYETAILHRNGIMDKVGGLRWEEQESSINFVAEYDVANKLHVRDVRQSCAYYSTMGFVPDSVEDDLEFMQSIILRHCSIPGLKLLLWQDERFSEQHVSKSKKKPEIDKTVTFVLMPKTLMDFQKIMQYYQDLGLVEKDETEYEFDNVMALSVGRADNIYIEVLYFKR